MAWGTVLYYILWNMREHEVAGLYFCQILRRGHVLVVFLTDSRDRPFGAGWAGGSYTAVAIAPCSIVGH